MNWLGHVVQKYITIDDSVLDLGCGIMQATTNVLETTKRKNPYQEHRCFLEPKKLQDLGFQISFPEPDKNTLGIFNKR